MYDSVRIIEVVVENWIKTCDRRLLVVARSDWKLDISGRVLRGLDKTNFEPPAKTVVGKSKKILRRFLASILSYEWIRKEFSISILVNFFWF